MDSSSSLTIGRGHRDHYARPSVISDTITLIVVSIASFALANRVEWDSPRFGTFLRLIPVAGALLWLFRRMSGCEVGSRVRFGEEVPRRRRGFSGVSYSHSDSTPWPHSPTSTGLTSYPPPPPPYPTSVSFDPILTSPAAFPGGGPGPQHAYVGGTGPLPHLQNDWSYDPPESLFPVGNESGTAPGYQPPPAYATTSSSTGPGQRQSYTALPLAQPPSGGGLFSGWFRGWGSGSTTTSTNHSSFGTSSSSDSNWSLDSHSSTWSSSTGGGGGGSEPVMYSVGSHDSSQGGPGPNHQYRS